MFRNFLYSQTHHLQLGFQLQILVDDDVCIVRTFHVLHLVVGYVGDYSQMTCSIVGMLDGHDFRALEDQRLVAYIDLRDVGIGWSAAVVYQSLAVDALRG